MAPGFTPADSALSSVDYSVGVAPAVGPGARVLALAAPVATVPRPLAARVAQTAVGAEPAAAVAVQAGSQTARGAPESWGPRLHFLAVGPFPHRSGGPCAA